MAQREIGRIVGYGEPRRRSRRFWFVACASALTACLVVLLGLVTVAGYLYARGVNDAFEKPRLRTQGALDILETSSLPAPWHAIGALSVPLLLDTAILVAREPAPEEAVASGDETFTYIESSGLLRSGGVQPAELLTLSNLEIEESLGIRSGTLRVSGGTVAWRALLGTVVRTGQRSSEAREDSVVVVAEIECVADRRLRIALWSTPSETASDADAADPTLEAGLRQLLAHFDLCPEAGERSAVERRGTDRFASIRSLRPGRSLYRRAST